MFDKKLVISVLIVLSFVIKQVFGVEIPEEKINELADILVNLGMVIVSIMAIWKAKKNQNHGEK